MQKITDLSPFQISPHSDCFGKKFGFCLGYTAKFQNSFFRQNAERRKAKKRVMDRYFNKNSGLIRSLHYLNVTVG